jgi:hypothetical protein
MPATPGTPPPPPSQSIPSNANALRTEFFQDIQLRLGSGIIDIELDPPHYDFALRRSLQRYRQASTNSTEEAFIFLDVQPDTSQYTLPPEVQEVRAVYRRGIGGTSGGAAVDPFSLAFTNNIYMIQNPGGLNSGGVGTLATYDFAMQYQSLVGRMFGRDIMFTWDASTKKLMLERNITATEQVALHVYTVRPEAVLLNDPYARIWLFDYTLAQCKLIMAEARGKFGTIAGPQGGISLNADALKTEANAEIERLDKELRDFLDSHTGAPFIIG